MSANDKQVDGSHYQDPIQTWDFITENKIPYLEGNIIKYVVRHSRKNGIRDLIKAQHYLERLIEEYTDGSVDTQENTGGEPGAGYVDQH